MATPKVKMPISTDQLSELLDIPATSEILGAFVTNDPLSITLIIASADDFYDLYLPDGGFDPRLSYRTVPIDFFNPAPVEP